MCRPIAMGFFRSLRAGRAEGPIAILMNRHPSPVPAPYVAGSCRWMVLRWRTRILGPAAARGGRRQFGVVLGPAPQAGDAPAPSPQHAPLSKAAYCVPNNFSVTAALYGMFHVAAVLCSRLLCSTLRCLGQCMASQPGLVMIQFL